MTREDVIRQRFLADLLEYEIEMMVDDGVYRHLAFRKPCSITRGFEIVT